MDQSMTKSLDDAPRWTLSELVAHASVALAEEGVEVSSQRVSDVPSARTVRYYSQHGLLSPPLAWRGRTALYGRVHLAQLVVIKRLQADGLTLAQVQEVVLGLSEEALFERAALPAEHDAAPARTRDASASQPGAPEDFWMSEPAAVDPEAGALVSAPRSPDPSSPLGAQGVWLEQGVMVLLEGAARPIKAHDMEGLRAAAAPLIQYLRARGILDSS